MTLLKLDHVTYVYKNKYQTVRAVNDACMEFEGGRVYAIVGKSGSGKTTMISLLGGLDLPTEGDVVFMGKSTRELELDRFRRESVSIIYQHYNLFPLLTVLENAMYPMELSGVSSKEAKPVAVEMLKNVGLKESQFMRYPSMLSGGEQQRVAIARTLASKPKVILADEPTGNLDVENSGTIVGILEKLAHELGYCVIIVTHDTSIPERADVVINMRDGVLTQVR